jgi:hypothetical protein
VPLLEPLLPGVKLQASRIAGRGLFVTDAVPSGTSVLRVDADLRELDGGPNHSCEPTLGWADDRTLVAARDLTAGEELTTDYSLSVVDPDFVMWCHCETYRCRQAIEGTDWRIPQLQTRYAGWWAPHVQQLIDAEGG